MKSCLRALFAISFTLVASCSPAQDPASPPTATQKPALPPTHEFSPVPTMTGTPQPHLSPVEYGPDLDDFPTGVNPLTGRVVEDPSLLELPAVLVSISNVPVTARPQAGPAFASWIFELFIGEGTTRFLGVFHGQYPRAVTNVKGGCHVREGIIEPAGNWVGNRVWLDEDEDGVQDPWEVGVGGICIRLLDAVTRKVVDETTTDSNGFYAFDLPSGESIIQFVRPDSYVFTGTDVGDDDRDSDADMTSGETRPFESETTAAFWDAGLLLTDQPAPERNPVVTGTPAEWYIPREPYVGPIRSGRLTYNQIGGMFPNSCLVYASAATDIGERLDACEIVYGVDRSTPNSALLTVSRLRALAAASLNPRQPVNYSGSLFSDAVPGDGQPAEIINVHYHAYSQSGWRYDPISQSYLRYTDLADGRGELFAASDRLTGRQLAFENVIVVFAEHLRFRHNQLEIDFSPGQKHPAYLFRDGQAFRIFWSTANREWERTTGLLRPMYFVDKDNSLVPLHPGRIWIHIVTPFSSVTDMGNETWQVQFAQPYDPEDTPFPEP